MDNDISGGLSLGNLFQAAGLAPEAVQVIRHTLKPDGLKTRADAMGPSLLPYVREQGIRNSKLPATPPRIWLNFLATTGRRARFLTAHENHGEVLAERTDLRRYFDLRPSPVFAALADRLVIEWTNDPVNWADTSTGRLYVGKANGAEKFLGRWGEYARNGHGGNVALRELAAADARHRQHFQFSILQVFSPSAPTAQVDAAEAHFKRALLTRQFGMNLN